MFDEAPLSLPRPPSTASTTPAHTSSVTASAARNSRRVHAHCVLTADDGERGALLADWLLRRLLSAVSAAGYSYVGW